MQENFCFIIWILFFWNFHFKLWFSMKKFVTESCFLKWARKVKNLLLSAEQIESKRYFLDVMFFIEITFFFQMWIYHRSLIWFLNKNWTQNLSFRKIKFLPKMIFQIVLFSISSGTTKSQFKIWHVEKLSFQSLILLGKSLLHNLILFFREFRFKLLFSMERLASKSCLLK